LRSAPGVLKPTYSAASRVVRYVLIRPYRRLRMRLALHRFAPSSGACSPGVELDQHLGGDQTQHAVGVRGGHGDARTEDPLADPLHPDDAVGVEHHLDDTRVVEQVGERTERTLERARAPRLALRQLGLSVRRHLRSSIGRSEVLRRIDMGPRDCAREPSQAPEYLRRAACFEVS
jgi:hypothetical protein